MRIAILASGGKDSSYAHWWTSMRGWHVDALITCVVTGNDSLMFQVPGVEVVELQARAADVAWMKVEVSGCEEIEIAELKTAIAQEMQAGGMLVGIDGLVSGALRSDYQRSRIEIMCEQLNLRSFCPLWHTDGDSHLNNLIEEGFEVLISSVSTEGLGQQWLGRTLDLPTLEGLRESAQQHRFNVDGEGGEFETIVVAGPHLERDIEWDATTDWSGSRGQLRFEPFYLSG